MRISAEPIIAIALVVIVTVLTSLAVRSCERQEKAALAKLHIRQAIPTSVEVSNGLLTINHVGNGENEPICVCNAPPPDKEIVVNPMAIVSFSDWTAPKFPQSCSIRLSSSHAAGKSGSAPDELFIKGLTKTEMQEKFNEARIQQLIPKSK